MIIHAELAQRAGISIDWSGTDKAAYLTVLTQEIEKPGVGALDAYLRPHLRDAVGAEHLAEHVSSTRGLEGYSSEDNTILGKVTDPELQARYEQQKLQRQRP